MLYYYGMLSATQMAYDPLRAALLRLAGVRTKPKIANTGKRRFLYY